jgi:hypothetical protein
LLIDASGALFGTTSQGGTGCGGFCGTVFELSAPAAGGRQWTETVLHSFGREADGTGLYAGLTAANGILYGATSEGGSGFGTLFALSPPPIGQSLWTMTVLHRFRSGLDGATPYAGLIVAQGALYGTTPAGGYGCGGTGCGTVFKLDP